MVVVLGDDLYDIDDTAQRTDVLHPRVRTDQAVSLSTDEELGNFTSSYSLGGSSSSLYFN